MKRTSPHWTGQSRFEELMIDVKSDQLLRRRCVFIPAPFPVQEDCFGHRNGFGELSKVHWIHLSFSKRWLCNVFTPFGWSYSELGERVITRNWQRLLLPVNVVSFLRVKASLLTLLVLLLSGFTQQNASTTLTRFNTFSDYICLKCRCRGR